MADQDKDKKEQTTEPDITKSDDNSGSFVWKAPKDYKPKADADVKISQPTSPTSPAKPAVQDTTPDKFKGCKAVKVQSGQTLLEIANHYDVALEQLRYFNGVNKATMKINDGQTIYIPKGAINVPVGK